MILNALSITLIFMGTLSALLQYGEEIYIL